MGIVCCGTNSGLKVYGDTEVQKFAESGDSRNRICIVLLGDGYVDEQRGLFFQDAQRYADHLLQAPTFQTFAPLFNISAVFVPSADAGIATKDCPKDTVFGLFRDNPRRIAMKSSMKYWTARSACKIAGKCDFFVLIGNDDHYGGTAHEDHVLITRSRATGWITLRHELGHIFAKVGEEYDGGVYYSGVNYAPQLHVPWAHWLTDPSKPTRQRSCQRLCKHGCFEVMQEKTSFYLNSDGTYARWVLEFAVRHGSLRVFLDGQELVTVTMAPEGIDLPPNVVLDRQMFAYRSDTAGLTAGSHCLEFEAMEPQSQGPGADRCQLSFVEVVEYGTEAEFVMEPGYIGAYPTWDRSGRETYRPTHNQCLMRNMHSGILCPVCKEAAWHNMLAKVSLIDAVDVTSEAGLTTIAVRPLPLERLDVFWAQGGVARHKFDGLFSFKLQETEAKGRWEVSVVFRTPEVRKDKSGILSSRRKFIV